MFLECRSCQGLGECVCLQVLSFEVFEADDLVVDLFNHKVYACQEMFAPFVFPREIVGECDQTLIVDEQRGWMQLRHTKFFQHCSEIDNVLRSFFR